MLKINIDGWSVVMVGSWNRAIFTPAWMGGGRLTALPEIGIEFPVDNPRQPVRYLFENICIEARPSRLEIKPMQDDPQVLAKVKTTAKRILEDLPHTPISAIGINFSYLITEPSGLLLDVFKLADANQLADSKCAIKSTSITRTLTSGELLVNLNINFQTDGNVLINVNFHSNAQSTKEAQLFLESADFRTRAFEILADVYKLKPDSDEGEL